MLPARYFPRWSREKKTVQSHFDLVTNPLLTKLVRSRWLNIVLVPFAFFSDLAGCHLVDKNAKKERGRSSHLGLTLVQ